MFSYDGANGIEKIGFYGVYVRRFFKENARITGGIHELDYHKKHDFGLSEFCFFFGEHLVVNFPEIYFVSDRI